MSRFPEGWSTMYFWRISAALGLIPLAGCMNSSTDPHPAVEVRIQRVEVPVAVACLKRSDIPAEPEKVGGKLSGDARHDLDIVSASALQLRQAFREAAALLSGCAK